MSSKMFQTDSGMRAEVDLGLALATFLGGLWFLGFGVIERTILQSPADPMLLFFGISHGVVFLLFLYSLVLLFDMGISLVGDCLLPRIAYKIFLYLWPLSLIFVSASFVIHRSQLMSVELAVKGMLIIATIAAAVLAAYGIWQNKPLVWKVSSVFGGFILAAFAYVFAMGAILPDVNIKTDKEYYRLNDRILVNVRTSGYLFNPSITRIDIDGTREIDMEERGSAATFECKFEEAGARSRYIVGPVKIFVSQPPGHVICWFMLAQVGHASFVDDGEVVERRFPLSNGHGPLLGGLVNGHVDQLEG